MKTTKTILMKTACKLSVAFLLLLTSMAFTIKPVADTSYCSTVSNSGQVAISEKTVAGVDDPRWFFLTISGVWQKSNIGYFTLPIFYPGYSNCSNKKFEIFLREAKIAFNNHLKNKYSNIFPDGSLRISSVTYKGKIAQTGDYLLTKHEAWERTNTWIMEEGNPKGNERIDSFSFTCKDLE